MLVCLNVANFAVVEKAELEFSPNLNVFTGETGAGKSILIDAINIFLKQKVSQSSIRSGTDKLTVEALFSLNGEEIVLRREVKKNHSVSYINGAMVPFQVLMEKTKNLLNVYGQNEHLYLLKPVNHRKFMDNYSANSKVLARLAKLVEQIRLEQKELAKIKAQKDNQKERIDFLNFQINEIESLDLKKGEDEELEQKYKILASAEEILDKAGNLIKVFYQKENSIYNIMAENRKNLKFLETLYPELHSFHEGLESIYSLLPDYSASLSHIVGNIDFSDEERKKIDEKLLKINSLKSKYRLDLDGLLVKLQKLKEERESIQNIEFSMGEKEKLLNALFTEYVALNEKLRKTRREMGRKLSQLVETELSQLEMKRAKFVVEIEEIVPDLKNISETGTDKIEFYFSVNPGQNPAKISDVISGGELSRLMLVLKSIGNETSASTNIFDEIDSGIGGKTAEFVGEKLKKISRSNQVICISHLPQIAAFADKHFLIQKEIRNNETFSYTRVLQGEDKTREIARLMAGSAVNEDVLKAAENLLNKRSK